MGEEYDAPDAIEFSSRLLQLIDSGRLTATYKLATLTAIVDLCAEFGAPDTLSAKAVGQRVVELYWPQAGPFTGNDEGSVALRQSGMTSDIPDKLDRFRREHRLRGGATVEDARRVAPDEWTTLAGELTAVVVREPIPRLQRFGQGQGAIEDRFVYDIGWSEKVSRTQVMRDGFDDTMYFRPGVPELLSRMGPLLRPVLQARWATEVAKRNAHLVDEVQLAEFLFGADRISLERVRGPLLELQGHDCFYCGDRIRGRADVDHFLPWSRHPDNTLDNLVAAHAACNGSKSDSLAATGHLAHWLDRFRSGSPVSDDLRRLQDEIGWPRRPDRTLGSARAGYLTLPTGTMLWQATARFEHADRAKLHDLLVGSVTHPGAQEGPPTPP